MCQKNSQKWNTFSDSLDNQLLRDKLNSWKWQQRLIFEVEFRDQSQSQPRGLTVKELFSAARQQPLPIQKRQSCGQQSAEQFCAVQNTQVCEPNAATSVNWAFLLTSSPTTVTKESLKSPDLQQLGQTSGKHRQPDPTFLWKQVKH